MRILKTVSICLICMGIVKLIAVPIIAKGEK